MASVPALAVIFLAPQALLVAPGRAQDYPTHAVRIIVPFGAGGPADVAARVLGNALQKISSNLS